jgi:phosphoribosylformylglycinamidine (FGAM) synthase-like enzyme
MNLLKHIAISATVGAIIMGGSEFGQQMGVPGIKSVISSSEARVGRPLTPVSVAGVARRSARRTVRRRY